MKASDGFTSGTDVYWLWALEAPEASQSGTMDGASSPAMQLFLSSKAASPEHPPLVYFSTDKEQTGSPRALSSLAYKVVTKCGKGAGGRERPRRG